MKPDKKNVTLKDIAAKAGISAAAVSKALQGKNDISEDTIKKVQAIADELGYSPNIIAKSLRTGKIDALGVLIPDNSNPYNALVIKGVQDVANKYGFAVIVSNTNENAQVEQKALKTIISMNVAGILAIPVDLNNYNMVSVPLMFMSRYPYFGEFWKKAEKKFRTKFNFIVNDDYLGEYMAVEHLIKKGHEHIFLITGSKNADTVEGVMNLTRIQGYRQALEDNHMKFDESMIRYNTSNIKDSYLTVKELLGKSIGRTALCMNSDYCAIGAISAVCEAKKMIPEEIAIVGYDNIDMALYFSTPITTVHQEKNIIGSESAQHIINIIQGETNEIKQRVLKPTLVVRETT